MAGPVVLINVFEVPAQEADEFIRAWEEARDYMKQYPGHLDAALHQAITDSADFQFISIAHWRSAEEFNEAVTSAGFQDATADLRWTFHSALYNIVRTAHAGWKTILTTARQTANLVRHERFGAAVRSSIEELADWANVERPDLARLTPDWANVGRPDLARPTPDWAKVADLARLTPVISSRRGRPVAKPVARGCRRRRAAGATPRR